MAQKFFKYKEKNIFSIYTNSHRSIHTTSSHSSAKTIVTESQNDKSVKLMKMDRMNSARSHHQSIPATPARTLNQAPSQAYANQILEQAILDYKSTDFV